MRRDLGLSAALLLVLAAIVPAYDRVFADTTWRGPVLLAGATAVVVATLLRRLRVPAPAAAVVGLVALAAYVYTTALPDVGLLPDTSSWRAFLDLMAQAVVDLRDEPAPAVATPAFSAALSVGAWIAFHVAHELAVRARTPGVALALPTVLWALPLAVPMDAGGELGRALWFLAAAGAVVLLGTDDGREDAPGRFTASGIAVGVGALVLVVAAPTLLPGYGAAPLVDLASDDTPRGYQPIVDVSERLKLPDTREVLRVRSADRSYLRLAGLDSFDGATWRLGPVGVGSYSPAEDDLFPATRDLPPESEAFATSPVEVDVEVLDLANIYVPTPYQPVRVTGPFRDEMVWSTDGGFLATWNLAEGAGGARVGVVEGFEYRVEAERPTPDIELLRDVTYDAETLERWTALPQDYPALGDVARDVFDDAGATTPVDQALALQDWFTESGGFTYDLDVDALRGDGALERFVLEDRVGYCEYFATAMAVMLRESGIPARVVVGFLPGDITAAADPAAGIELTEYTVTTDDAHAWVEVLFPGFGWVTFEPTPRSDLTQIVPTVDDLAPTENLRERRVREALEAAEDPDPADAPEDPEAVEPPTDPAPVEQDPPAGTDAEDAGGGSRTGAGWWVALAGVVALGALVAAAGSRRRPDDATADPTDRVVAAQRRVLTTARQHGIGRRPHESTHEVVSRWRAEGRVGADAASFAALAERAAFGGAVDDRSADEAVATGAAIETSLRASVPVRDRAIAPVRVPLDTLAGATRRVTSHRRRRRGGR